MFYSTLIQKQHPKNVARKYPMSGPDPQQFNWLLGTLLYTTGLGVKIRYYCWCLKGKSVQRRVNWVESWWISIGNLFFSLMLQGKVKSIESRLASIVKIKYQRVYPNVLFGGGGAYTNQHLTSPNIYISFRNYVIKSWNFIIPSARRHKRVPATASSKALTEDIMASLGSLRLGQIPHRWVVKNT